VAKRSSSTISRPACPSTCRQWPCWHCIDTTRASTSPFQTGKADVMPCSGNWWYNAADVAHHHTLWVTPPATQASIHQSRMPHTPPAEWVEQPQISSCGHAQPEGHACMPSWEPTMINYASASN
jgi:hypothetical protein